MRKPFICILILLSLVLTGCSQKSTPPSTAPEETTTPAAATIPVETSGPEETTVPVMTTAPVETEAPAAGAPTESEAAALPYLQRIDRADQSIFSGPGYDYTFAGTVRERGTYTIVEEAWDSEGNLWGRLKSGAGWVNLTEIRNSSTILISANYADENLLLHGDYHYFPGEKAEYCISVAIRAYGNLRDVTLFAYEFHEDDFVPGADFYTLPAMTPEMPLVAELAFPGDMSMYGIRFLDEKGETHICTIYISGRNGALVLTEEN